MTNYSKTSSILTDGYPQIFDFTTSKVAAYHRKGFVEIEATEEEPARLEYLEAEGTHDEIRLLQAVATLPVIDSVAVSSSDAQLNTEYLVALSEG